VSESGFISFLLRVCGNSYSKVKVAADQITHIYTKFVGLVLEP